MNHCERNLAGPEEDISPSRIAYHPCRRTPVVVVRWSDRECCMCPEHAREAERDGCEVDWDEVAA